MQGYVKPKKHLGQHFLVDKNIAAKIASFITYSGNVLEIGPGKGMLTEYILKKYPENLWVAEIDSESVEYLKANGILPSEKILEHDILSLNFNEYFTEPITLTGNLPYNISSPIMFKLLENRQLIKEAVFMVQKEVAERICEKHGSKTYGILSVLLQAYYQPKYLFSVNESVFFPKPNVKSAVFKLTALPERNQEFNEKRFIQIVKAGFNQRRKTLSNSLKSIIKPDADLGRFAGLRAEQLSVDDFIELTQLLT